MLGAAAYSVSRVIALWKPGNGRNFKSLCLSQLLSHENQMSVYEYCTKSFNEARFPALPSHPSV